MMFRELDLSDYCLVSVLWLSWRVKKLRKLSFDEEITAFEVGSSDRPVILSECDLIV